MKLLTLTMAMVQQAFAWPAIQITEDGQPKTLYVAGSGSGNGNEVSLTHNNGLFLAQTNENGYSPNMNYHPNLLGGSIEYDVNLSDVGCSCNAAFYLVGMPGHNPGGSLNATPAGNYYCDANRANNSDYCPEMDIQEANKFAW